MSTRRNASKYLAILSLVLLQAPTARGSGNQRYTECKKICKDYFETNLDKRMCQPALNLMPRPDVYKSCVKGRVLGFEVACMPTCMGDDIERTDSYEACKSEAKRASPNHQFPWCRRGHDVTITEVQEAISAQVENMNHRELRDVEADPKENGIVAKAEKSESQDEKHHSKNARKSEDKSLPGKRHVENHSTKSEFQSHPSVKKEYHGGSLDKTEKVRPAVPVSKKEQPLSNEKKVEEVANEKKEGKTLQSSTDEMSPGTNLRANVSVQDGHSNDEIPPENVLPFPRNSMDASTRKEF